MKINFGKKIGSGATSTVYAATCMEGHFFQQELAIKIMHINHAEGTEELATREIALLKKLNNSHNNVIKCFDWEIKKGRYLFYFERMTCTLYDRMKLSSLSIHELLSIIRDMAEGLRFIHSLGFVHCDIKPENIFLTREGLAKIGDFGLSTHTSIPRSPCGSCFFLAPEVAYEVLNGNKMMIFYPQIDIYSFGLVVKYMLTRKMPFSNSKNKIDILQSLAGYYTGNYKASTFMTKNQYIPPYVEPEFISIVILCLKRNPRKRASITNVLYLLTLLNARKHDNVFETQASIKNNSGQIGFWSNTVELNININCLSNSSAAESLKNRSGEVDCWSFGKI